MSQYIDRKTVLNLVYTQQATRMADAYETLLADFSQMTAWGRGLESDLSHARVEISFLKAEVERLTERNKFLEQIDSYLQGANEYAYEKRCDELEAEVERLRASSFVTAVPSEHYERVIKAGDAMARIIAPPTHGTGEWDGEWEAWKAAKEGKPSV